jgi:hypothetical protein
LRKGWLATASRDCNPLTDDVLALTRKLPDHEEKTTLRLAGKCSKLERYAGRLRLQIKGGASTEMRKKIKLEISRGPKHEKLPWGGLRAKDYLSRLVTRAVKEARERKETESWAEIQISRVLNHVSSETAMRLLIKEVRRRRKRIPTLQFVRDRSEAQRGNYL